MMATRQNMIDQLVAFSLRAALDDTGAGWLREMFEQGFAGFSSLTYAELVREMQFRGLLDEGFAIAEPGDSEQFDDEASVPDTYEALGQFLRSRPETETE
jgi:hypothetical protein